MLAAHYGLAMSDVGVIAVRPQNGPHSEGRFWYQVLVHVLHKDPLGGQPRSVQAVGQGKALQPTNEKERSGTVE